MDYGGVIMQYVLSQDQIVKRNEVFVDFEDRGYQFGDGIYEVIGVYNKKSFRMKEHLERLERSAKNLQITLPYSMEELDQKLEELRERNHFENGWIYVQITRGVAPRNHPFPTPSPEPKLIGYTKEVSRPSKESYENGVDAILTKDIRWLRCDIKSVNLLPNVLAKQEAIEKNCFEAILYREGGFVTEGSGTNVFMVKDNKIYTHPSNNYILNGITRQAVLELCKELEFEVIQERFDQDFLLQADEVFITGTYIDIVPIKKIDDKVIGKPGPITNMLRQRLQIKIEQE